LGYSQIGLRPLAGRMSVRTAQPSKEACWTGADSDQFR